MELITHCFSNRIHSFAHDRIRCILRIADYDGLLGGDRGSCDGQHGKGESDEEEFHDVLGMKRVWFLAGFLVALLWNNRCLFDRALQER